LRKKNAPVVIYRKDKRLFKTGHLTAFMLTGGLSSVYTAAKAATNAGYNARTRKLTAVGEPDQADELRAEQIPGSAEYRERHERVEELRRRWLALADSPDDTH
jgi:hypothetical protein